MIRIIITIFTLLSVTSNYISAQVVTATQTDSLVGDHQAIGIANPKDTVRYKTTISVSGANATGVNFNNAIPTNTTMVAGSVKTSALCRDDDFATSFNTLLNTGNVLTNDFGLPGVTVVSFGTTMSGGTTTLAGNAGTTDGGGTLTVNADGSFSYQPMAGFFGMDQFTYIGTTGVAGLQNGLAFVVINVATDITFTTMDTHPACNGAPTGSIVFSASGGTGALTYSITGAMGTYQMSPTFSGLPAGLYNLAVKDAVNYIKTGTTTLNDPPLITFTTMDVHNSCNGDMAGSITFSAMGGTGTLMYSITGAMGSYQASNVFTGLAANTYNLAVKDANNCVVTGTTTINEPAAITFTYTTTNITCNGLTNGSIVFNTTTGGTSPYTYSITGLMGTFTGTTNYTGLSAGMYDLVAKDFNNCNSTVEASTVTEPGAIVVSGMIPTLAYNVAMSNATFSKTGGTGSPATPWSAIGLPTGVSINTATGVVSGTPTQTGSFSATITYIDANGCFDDLAITVMVGPNLVTNTYPNVVGNTQLVADGYMPSPTTPFTTDATNILTNDMSDAAITVTSGTFATMNGGSITIGADGKFIYSPPVGNLSSDSYTYTGTSNGVSATAAINFTFGAGMIWFVNNTYGGANGVADGRSHRPFTSVNMAEAPSANGHYIYVHTGSGNTTGTIVLKPLQLLRGEGTTLNVGVLGLSAGTKPTLTGMITLANSVTVDGFDMSNGATTAITSSGATGVNVSVGNVNTNGAPNAVSLTNTTGSVTIAGGSQTSSTGATFNISGGTVSLTYSGDITQAVNTSMVSVSGGHNTGTITFNTGTLSATNGTGLQFDNADGTYNFSGTTTLNGGQSSIAIYNGSAGTFSFGSNTTVNNPAAAAMNIVGGTASVTYSGNISRTTNLQEILSVSGGHSGGTITFQTGTLSATIGNGLQFNNADGTYNFNGITTLSGTSLGINILNGTAGTFTFGTGVSITCSFPSFTIAGTSSSCSITYSGNITQNANAVMIDIEGGHNTGTITFQTGTLSATNGSGIFFDNADGTYNFNGTTTLNGGDAAIDILNGSSGTFSFSSGTSITNPTNNVLNIGSSTANVTYSGSFSKTNNSVAGIFINGETGGTININGTGTKTLSTMASNAVHLSTNTGSTINFSGNNLLLTTTSGTGFNATGGGTISVTGTGNIITTTSGTGLNINAVNAGGSGVTFNSITTTTGQVANIQNSTGNKSLGTVNNTSSGATPAINFLDAWVNDIGGVGTSTLRTTTAPVIQVGSTGGNTTTVNGQTQIALESTGSGQGISATGGTVTITGGNFVITTASGTGFDASSGGTVTITGANNTINTGTGTALNVVGTTIGAGNLNFKSISSTGGSATGIILNNTGASGGLIVTGDGSNTSVGGNSSGGTISGKSGADGSTTTGIGIYLNNTRDVILRRMTINGTNQNFGIRGVNVTNFNLQYSTVSGTNGTDVGTDEGSVNFDNMWGASTITNCSIEGGLEDNLNVVNTSGTLNRLVITGSTFGFNNTISGNNNLLLESQNAGTVFNFTIQTCLIKGARADWINASNNSTSTMDAVVGGVGLGNTFDNLAPNAHPGAAPGGNRLVFGAIGPLTFDIRENTFKGSKGEAIRVRGSGTAGGFTGTAIGYVRNNAIGVQATANSGSSEGSGIFIFGDGGSDMTVSVLNNSVYQYNNHGISFTFGDELNDGSVFHVICTGNTVSNPGNINSDFNGIHLNNGTAAATDNFTTCFHMATNILTGSGNGAISPNNQQFRLRQRQTTTVRLPGYVGANNNDAAVVAFLQGQNTVTAGNGAASNTVPTGGGFVGGASCNTP